MSGGSYELFAGTFIGEPGSFDLYFGAPERCGQMTIAVDGDTVVDLPLLEQCDLVPIGTPEEIARRTEAPFDAGGTLHVELPSAFAPEGFADCERRAVLLPSGTTLNDIGRGDAWPVGGFTLALMSARYLGSGDPNALRLGSEPGLVPIVAVGATGSAAPILPQIGGERPRPWDESLPDPIPLASGSYDLRLQEWCFREEQVEGPDNERTQCAMLTVEVDGETVVTAPELGACP